MVFSLAWAMLPGSTEFLENAYHLTVHGDFAHDQAQRGHTPFNPEHGCGGGFHLCSCCHVQPSLFESMVSDASGEAPGAAFLLVGSSHLLPGFFPRLENPPRA
ncbi:MAG TPA: hypothetical protein DD490_32665 [Acidobacteria bacterium]|nr:hypothetical protein [Acidobacteriota bacterium]